MKKLILILSTILILTLTACGSVSSSAAPASRPQGSGAGELSATTQLIIATFKLEETENAVTPEQAAEQLPLWQTMQVLSESDTAADQEKEALVAQIQETMTAEQIQAITDMKLTREDMMSILQEQGLAIGGGPAGQNTNSQNGNANGGGGFRPGSDELPGGAPPGGFPGGGPGGGGSGLSPDQIATAQASRQNSSGSFVSPILINALIEYLQEKAGS
jgi:hypothetical protein